MRKVFALPNASSTGLEWMSRSCMLTLPGAPPTLASDAAEPTLWLPAISARKRNTCLEFSVLPVRARRGGEGGVGVRVLSEREREGQGGGLRVGKGKRRRGNGRGESGAGEPATGGESGVPDPDSPEVTRH